MREAMTVRRGRRVTARGVGRVGHLLLNPYWPYMPSKSPVGDENWLRAFRQSCPGGGPMGPKMAPKWPLNALRCGLVTSYAFSDALQNNFAHIFLNFPCCWDVKNHVFIGEDGHF